MYADDNPVKQLNVKNWLAKIPDRLPPILMPEDKPGLTLKAVLKASGERWDWFRLLNRGVITVDYLINVIGKTVCDDHLTSFEKPKRLTVNDGLTNIIK